MIFAECNFGYAWYEDEIKEVHTQYKAFSHVEIVADIGLHIGLRGINVTLKGVANSCITIILSVYTCEQECRNISFASESTTTTRLDGLTRGRKDAWDLVALQEDSTVISAPSSSGARPILSSGWQNTSRWMASRFVGEEDFALPVGMRTYSYGK